MKKPFRKGMDDNARNRLPARSTLYGASGKPEMHSPAQPCVFSGHHAWPNGRRIDGEGPRAGLSLRDEADIRVDVGEPQLTAHLRERYRRVAADPDLADKARVAAAIDHCRGGILLE